MKRFTFVKGFAEPDPNGAFVSYDDAIAFAREVAEITWSQTRDIEPFAEQIDNIIEEAEHGWTGNPEPLVKRDDP